jgi:hypothetical protein
MAALSLTIGTRDGRSHKQPTFRAIPSSSSISMIVSVTGGFYSQSVEARAKGQCLTGVGRCMDHPKGLSPQLPFLPS